MPKDKTTEKAKSGKKEKTVKQPKGAKSVKEEKRMPLVTIPAVKKPESAHPMFKAVCAACKQTCDVPFKPTADKPVYCKACFEKHRGANRPFQSGGGRPSFRAICASCGRSCEVNFQPKPGKQIFCNDCFAKRRQMGDRPAGQFQPRGQFQPPRQFQSPGQFQPQNPQKGQYDLLNAKLDRIIGLLSALQSKAAEPANTEEKKPAKKSAKKK